MYIVFLFIYIKLIVEIIYVYVKYDKIDKGNICNLIKYIVY